MIGILGSCHSDLIENGEPLPICGSSRSMENFNMLYASRQLIAALALDVPVINTSNVAEQVQSALICERSGQMEYWCPGAMVHIFFIRLFQHILKTPLK